MSRTHAHTPYHVNARRDPEAVIHHDGCPHDPSGLGRIIRWDDVEIHQAPAWIPSKVEVRRWSYVLRSGLTAYTDVYVYVGKLKRYVLDSTVDDEEPKLLDPNRIYGTVVPCRATKMIFAPLIRIERVPVRKVVQCDVNDSSRGSWHGCYFDSDNAGIQTYGIHHKCEWHGLKRDLWYKPERRQGREFGRAAAAAYNTYGEAPEDEPYTPGSPRGLWGGGWVD